MLTKIKDAVQNLSKMTLNDSDLMGKGSYAEVYKFQTEFKFGFRRSPHYK